MPDASTFAFVALAALALAVVPGPAVLFIVTRSVSHGRAAGLVSVAGIHLGTLVHVVAAALGLSALLMRSAVAFDALRYVGAAYLVYLGVRRLLATPTGDGIVVTTSRALVDIFKQGVFVNLLNPKTAAFFFTFLPQFVKPDRGAVAMQILSLGVLFGVIASITDAAYAVIASRLGDRLRSSAQFSHRMRLFSGSVYIALGLTAAISGSRPRAEAA
jgi:threonine/homoserine/homoserine lactone efflux protein